MRSIVTSYLLTSRTSCAQNHPMMSLNVSWVCEKTYFEQPSHRVNLRIILDRCAQRINNKTIGLHVVMGCHENEAKQLLASKMS